MAVLAALFVSLIWAITPACAQNSSTTPQVDLGYEIHQGFLNTTGNFYNFSNIPYATPPLGDLRFKAPVPLATDITPRPVNDGSRFAICPQGIPAWTAIAEEVLIFGTGSINISAGYTPPNITTLPTPAFGTSEDCLLLDILVPQVIFDNRSTGSGAPVLLWIHGGGYTLGGKTFYGSGAGLVKASQSNGKEGVIFMAINYRLGLFGFLSGPTFGIENGTSNAGLLDQRQALLWVQQNIAKFGGDPNRVTIMGESAGGGSIIHQITAYGGMNGQVPFQQAIVQSGAFLPVPTEFQKEEIFESFLDTAGVRTLQQARNLSTDALQLTNAKMIGEAPYGSFIFNPVVDGSFSPALPGNLLLQGQYDKSLNLVIGHNINEGILFTSPFLPNETAFLDNIVLASFPNTAANNGRVASFIADTLYPPIFNGSFNYTSQLERAAFLITESLFTCNTNYLARAFREKAHSYLFSVPPSFHGDDIPYTFFIEPNTAVLNDTLAVDMQEYFTNFASTGDPNGPGLPNFPSYVSGETATEKGTLLNLNETFISLIGDNTANARCRWWQKGLYF